MKKPFVHSHSALELFELCPKKFYEEKIAKSVPFVESEQVKWGLDVHKALELAVKDKAPLDKRYEMYQEIVDRVSSVQATAYTELKLGVNRDFQCCDFFDSTCYVRGIADLVLDYGDKIAALDWKTGKQKHGSRQLTLMALLLFARFPDVQEIYTAYVWLQSGKLTPESYKREQIEELWELFIQPMKELEWCLENNVWHPRENFLCRNWCGVLDCMYNGRRGK